ncbi:hypothetical protein BUALT_Bualt14G0050000 [Buddleja alternifolia]|uniref:Uncharacterized protein n=1 Tax=Buddleja alternifolia TaxID=168488 RepID=A0AAV6WNB9_9LAMI|nr:hypothetical protein BUALT_Bualt14G0050000 [Buddleja alternifolia]
MSAVGYRDLMDDPSQLQPSEDTQTNKNSQATPNVKPILRRSRSERSERLGFDNFSPNSSIVAIPGKKGAKEVQFLVLQNVSIHLKGCQRLKARLVQS